MNLDLFRYELCCDFRNDYEMDAQEAARFTEGFSLFLREMTKVNGMVFMNSFWLRENFYEMWNRSDPKRMLRDCIEHAMILRATAEASGVSES